MTRLEFSLHYTASFWIYFWNMKSTATVPPFLNFNMRSHHQEYAIPSSDNPVTNATTNGEGGFAAALRKLAQQTPGGFPSQLIPRGDSLTSSSSSKSIKGIQLIFFLIALYWFSEMLFWNLKYCHFDYKRQHVIMGLNC